MIEGIVGIPRHPSVHFGRLDSESQVFYIMHSVECLGSHDDLRECPYSKAMDLTCADGIHPGDDWVYDLAVPLDIDSHGHLMLLS